MPIEFEVFGNIKININDRSLIVGKTGVGKTFLVKNWLLPHYDRYIFWDVKHENSDVKHDLIAKTPKELENSLKSSVLSVSRKILYQPENPTPEDFDEVCRITFEHGNIQLYVDEASSVSNPGKILYWHNIIMTQGRSYGVGITNSSQRPRMIHNTLISESEHLFIFTLNLDTDIMKLRQQIGDATDEIRVLPEHHFLYHSTKHNKSFIFKPIKLTSQEKHIDEKGIEISKTIPKLELYQPNLEEYVSLAF